MQDPNWRSVYVTFAGEVEPAQARYDADIQNDSYWLALVSTPSFYVHEWIGDGQDEMIKYVIQIHTDLVG